MTLKEIRLWLMDYGGRPAAPRNVAEAIDNCPTTDVGFGGLLRLAKALEKRFITERRRQLSEQQLEAIFNAAMFAFPGGDTATAFPNLNRTQIALQMMARVLHPGLVNQRNTKLCVPAAGIMSVASAKPETYVRFVSELADRGTSSGVDGLPDITARQDVRDYEGPGTAAEQVKEADWIPCASLIGCARADIRDTGSGAESLFDWLRGFGFRSLVAMSNFPTSLRQSEPPGLIPSTASLTGESILAHMCECSARGYHLVMLGRGELASALMAIDKALAINRDVVTSFDAGLGIDIDDMETRYVQGQGINTLERASQFRRAREELELAKGNLENTVQRSTGSLSTENTSLFSVLWNTLIGRSRSHDFHATYVSRIKSDGPNVEFICSNWGTDQRWIRLPKAGVANKLAGFVAAM